MTPSSYVPERGDVVYVDLDPAVGHEMSKRRPALVLSPASYNKKTGLFVACAVTNRPKGYPWEVPIPAGLAVTGVILADQVRCLAWKARMADLICKVPDEVLRLTLRRLQVLLGFIRFEDADEDVV